MHRDTLDGHIARPPAGAIQLVTAILMAGLALDVAHAQEPSFTEARAETSEPVAPTAPPSSAEPAGELTPPALRSHPDAPYPPAALEAHQEGTVELELSIDETGKVIDARVLKAAGHGFDEAALLAVRSWTFEPALRGGMPVAAAIQLSYPFTLPIAALPTPPPAAPAAGPSSAPSEPLPNRTTPPPATRVGEPAAKASESSLVLGRRPISAASSFSVRDHDFSLRPVGSVQDILRVTPGLVLVQHSGGGKANQYFLRGFDADHGTDLALSIDGIPINMVSHAHGQGFADTNFIIPEVVERVEVTKGPYFAQQGDFATAGAVNLISRDSFEHSSLGFGFGGSPGHGSPNYRALAIASPQWDIAKALFAAEIGRQNSPFQNPEGWDKLKLYNKLTFSLSPTSTLTVGGASYASDWHGSGQIPVRAVEQKLVSRFGSIDPNEGGSTARHQFFVAYKVRPSEKSELNALIYAGSYRFNMFSNFTLYLRDPDHGDEIEQVDRRVFYGGKLSYRVVQQIGKVRFDTSMGAEVRSDDIDEQLWNTSQRQRLSAVADDSVHETLGGIFVNEEVTPTKWLRLSVGGRADFISFAVDDQLTGHDAGVAKSGTAGAHQLRPKANLVLTPVDEAQAQLDLYANYGEGFHSNDVRGAFARPAVTPMTRAKGEEVGARTRLFERWDLAGALWRLTLDNETLWVGDEGTTEVSDASLRYGAELETRFELTKWLAVDGDVTFTHSRYQDGTAKNVGLPLAPKRTWAGGLSARHPLGAGVARGGLRFYGIGDRPASDDGAIVAEGFTQLDLHLGYRHRRFDLAFDIENLLNGSFRSAQFDTVSRLRTDPALGTNVPANYCGKQGYVAGQRTRSAGTLVPFAGCEGVDFTPAYPLTARLMATFYLD